MILIDFFQPFMIRAIYAGLMVAILCATLGVFITLKKQSFLTDAIAHASLAGIAIGLFFSFNPTLIAMIVAFLMSISITFLQKKYQISFDSIIGAIYSFLFAGGIIIISLTPGYQPELISYLFGSILSVTWPDIFQIALITITTIILIIWFFDKLLYLTFDKQGAYIRGINVNFFEYLINALSSVAVIGAIRVVGVVMVTALIIIPATSAKLVAKNFSQMFLFSSIFSIISTIAGLIISYLVNIPSGATIVICSSVIFFALLIVKSSKKAI